MKSGAYSSFNNAQSAYDNMLPPEYADCDKPDDPRPTAEEMAARYTVAALKQMHSDLSAEELASVTPEELAEWALNIAEANGEEWQKPLPQRFGMTWPL